MELRADKLCLGYGDRVVVNELNLNIPNGKVTAILGRNASGKSTILKAFARLLKPNDGAVLLNGKAIHELPTKTVAQHLAILPQTPQAPDGITVEELVWFGRHPYQGLLGLKSKQDREIVRWALTATDMIGLSDRPLSSLSGGQRQRAWIATALAQDSQYLLLDEPTTYLDIAYQLDVLELLVSLNRQTGRTIVMVLHDLNQGARYADHFVAVKNGKVEAQGPPKETLTAALVESVFGIQCQILSDPYTDTPLCVPACFLNGAFGHTSPVDRGRAGRDGAKNQPTVPVRT